MNAGRGKHRTIDLLLSLEAGAEVRMGDRRWQGEDPAMLDSSLRATLVAVSEDTAELLMNALFNPFNLRFECEGCFRARNIVGGRSYPHK